MLKRLNTSHVDSKLKEKCPSSCNTNTKTNSKNAHVGLKQNIFADSPGLYMITPLSGHYHSQPHGGSTCQLGESYSSLLRGVRAPNLNRTEQKENRFGTSNRFKAPSEVPPDK